MPHKSRRVNEYNSNSFARLWSRYRWIFNSIYLTTEIFGNKNWECINLSAIYLTYNGTVELGANYTRLMSHMTVVKNEFLNTKLKVTVFHNLNCWFFNYVGESLETLTKKFDSNKIIDKNEEEMLMMSPLIICKQYLSIS